VMAPPGDQIYPDSVSVALSPDGTMVAFVVGTVSRSETQLWVRSLDSLVARRLEGGDGAALVFWSPDSKRIGFLTQGKLKTIARTGGRADVLADAPGPRGGVWTPSNEILFAPDAGGPLFRVSTTGGQPTPITKIDPALKEYSHRFPTLLPDGRHFLYASLPGKGGRFDIYAGSLDDLSQRTLVGSMEAAPIFAEPGWLLYARRCLAQDHR
jgi:Tol biopolymer transport system component